MPKHKFTLLFQASLQAGPTSGGGYGWSESFYDGNDFTDDQASTRCQTYKNVRLALLSVGWSITQLRIAQLDAFNNPARKGLIINLAPQGNEGTYAGVGVGGGSGPEQAFDAINIAIQSVAGSRRSFLMRGIGVGVIAASGRFLNPAAWGQPFAGWAADISPGGVTPPLSLRIRTAVQDTQLTSVLLAAPAGVNLPCDAKRPLVRVPTGTLAAGVTAAINGVVGLQGMNAVWRVVATQPDPANIAFTFASLAPRRRITITGAYSLGGSIRYWTYALTNITGATAGKGTSRKTGRPPSSPRGRRSSRVA
jgi:hypothetical protein